MLWLDWVILVVVGLSVWYGIKNGLVNIIADLCGLAGGWWLGTHQARNLGSYLLQMNLVHQRFAANLLASVIIYIGIFMIASYVGKALSKELDVALPLRFANEALGGFLGLARGILILLPLIFPILYFQTSWLEHSVFLKKYNGQLTPLVRKVELPKLKQFLPSEFYRKMENSLPNDFIQIDH